MPSPPPQAAAAARIAAELANHVPGASITVASGGRIVWRHAIGYADIEARQPVTDATTFAVYSVAKSWTAALAARLVVEGKLRPNTSITSYIQTAPPGAEGITAMLLATHRSGVRHYRDAAEAEARLTKCSAGSACVAWLSRECRAT